ncbi:MAG TPA: hypothetical protein VGM88_14140 [Kofleriaceae bacterium]|jgi:hypothetical protein
MTTVRHATATDLPAIATFLAATLKGGAPARYRRFFEYTWLADKPDLGAVIVDDGAVHGYVGAIYADRHRAGATHRFCNLTSIAVDEPYRKHTLSAMALVMKPKAVTYTCFSPSPQMTEILDFFKFQHRANEKLVVGPLSVAGGVRGWGRALTRRPRIVTAAAALDAALGEDERAIARDHRAYRTAQILIEHGERRCFLVAVRRGRGARVFADILYASDPALLVEHLPHVHGPLFLALGTVLTGLDPRWGAPKPAFRYTKLRPIYARSPDLPLDAIDPLYSEFIPMYGVAA